MDSSTARKRKPVRKIMSQAPKRYRRGPNEAMPDLPVESERTKNPRLLTVGTLTYSIRPDGQVECERTDHTGRLCEPPDELKRHVRKLTGKRYKEYVAEIVEAHRLAEMKAGRLTGNRV